MCQSCCNKHFRQLLILRSWNFDILKNIFDTNLKNIFLIIDISTSIFSPNKPYSWQLNNSKNLWKKMKSVEYFSRNRKNIFQWAFLAEIPYPTIFFPSSCTNDIISWYCIWNFILKFVIIYIGKFHDTAFGISH